MALALKKMSAVQLSRYASLAVSGLPPGASIRIENIKPRFYQGITLKAGVYDLSFSARDHRSSKVVTTLRPGQDKILEVSLKKSDL
jgi:hypothetical protein